MRNQEDGRHLERERQGGGPKGKPSPRYFRTIEPGQEVAFSQESSEQSRPEDLNEKKNNQKFNSAPGDRALGRSRQKLASAYAEKPEPEDGQGGRARQQKPGLEIEAKLFVFRHRCATQFIQQI